jgi:hypothetical protein
MINEVAQGFDVSCGFSDWTFDDLFCEYEYTVPCKCSRDRYDAMKIEYLRRLLPGQAKFAAGECLVAALLNKIAVDVMSRAGDSDWNFHLKATFWSPELELTQYAFREVDDGYYYNVCIMDSVEEMMAMAQRHARLDDFEQFEESGWVTTPETVRRACEVILPALKTDNGKLFDHVSEILERDQQISANTVRELIESRNNGLKS